MFEKRTLEDLTKLDASVYLYVANVELRDIFCKMAREEGFVWPYYDDVDGEHVLLFSSEPKFENNLYIIHSGNHTIGYANSISHQGYIFADNIYRVDFSRYLYGKCDFWIDRRERYPKPLSSKKEPETQKPAIDSEKEQ